MADWVPNVLHTEFHLAEQYGPDTEPELLAMVKDRIARGLADKLAEHLMETPGGAIYSPVTFTIREASEFGDYSVHGTVHTLDLPSPESGEFRLINGPMHGAVVRPGAVPPELWPMPVIRPWLISSRPEPEMTIYERVPNVQAYRWRHA